AIVRVVWWIAAEKDEIHLIVVIVCCCCSGMYFSTLEIVTIEHRKRNMHGGCHHVCHNYPVYPVHLDVSLVESFQNCPGIMKVGQDQSDSTFMPVGSSERDMISMQPNRGSASGW
ncbi:MAG TPA: hypothetical protein DIW81_24720, partial [Planctomycetaceae bacterium]|nr:hypothetical protein [Planctomycetaceae bacterium]